MVDVLRDDTYLDLRVKLGANFDKTQGDGGEYVTIRSPVLFLTCHRVDVC